MSLLPLSSRVYEIFRHGFKLTKGLRHEIPRVVNVAGELEISMVGKCVGRFGVKKTNKKASKMCTE